MADSPPSLPQVTIEGIYIAHEASDPMISLPSAVCKEGVGIIGDRYSFDKNCGTYSVLRTSTKREGEREPGRQCTLISSDEVIDALGADRAPKCVGDLRRNIVLKGCKAYFEAQAALADADTQQLNSMVGCGMKLGSQVIVFAHRMCVPCMYNEKLQGIKGFCEDLWENAGLSCEILVGGTISVGESVTFLTTKEELENELSTVPEVDSGTQSPGFFIAPSKRSADMVRSFIQMKKNAHQELLKIDPEGVDRAERSYQKVGMRFWPPVKK